MEIVYRIVGLYAVAIIFILAFLRGAYRATNEYELNAVHVDRLT